MEMRITDEIVVELEEIAHKHGRVNPALVVRASKRKGSSMHSMFLWDSDADAAALGRAEIARQLIMRVKVTEAIAKQLNCSVHVRRFVGNVDADGCVPIETVLADDGMRSRMVSVALRDMESFRLRYEHLHELQPIFDAATSVEAGETVTTLD